VVFIRDSEKIACLFNSLCPTKSNSYDIGRIGNTNFCGQASPPSSPSDIVRRVVAPILQVADQPSAIAVYENRSAPSSVLAGCGKVRQHRSRIAQRLNESFRRPGALEGLFRSPRSIVKANGPTKCGPYLLASLLAAALLNGHFAHPSGYSDTRWPESEARRRTQ